jgi:hypothetical protein
MIAIPALYVAPVNLVGCAGGLLQGGIVYLVVSSLGNWISILFPMPVVVSGSGKPIHLNYKAVVAQLIAMLISPLICLPGAIGIGIEVLLQRYLHWSFVPVYFLSSAIELAVVFRWYLKILHEQARLLQSREPDILALITSDIE